MKNYPVLGGYKPLTCCFGSECSGQSVSHCFDLYKHKDYTQCFIVEWLNIIHAWQKKSVMYMSVEFVWRCGHMTILILLRFIILALKGMLVKIPPNENNHSVDLIVEWSCSKFLLTLNAVVVLVKWYDIFLNKTNLRLHCANSVSCVQYTYFCMYICVIAFQIVRSLLFNNFLDLPWQGSVCYPYYKYIEYKVWTHCITQFLLNYENLYVCSN